MKQKLKQLEAVFSLGLKATGTALQWWLQVRLLKQEAWWGPKMYGLKVYILPGFQQGWGCPVDRGRKGTGFNRSGISMASNDTCVPLLGTRQWPQRKPRPSGESVQKLTDIKFIYEGCMYLVCTFLSYCWRQGMKGAGSWTSASYPGRSCEYLLVARET